MADPDTSATIYRRCYCGVTTIRATQTSYCHCILAGGRSSHANPPPARGSPSYMRGLIIDPNSNGTINSSNIQFR